MRERLLRDESGFTLPELLVTMMLLTMVLFALYSIFDMSMRVFSFGNDKTEAVENARLGLEKMAREIKAAYPYDKAAGNTTVLITRTESQITFGNDLNSNREVDPGEVITYSLNGSTLQRTVGTGTAQPVVEYVKSDDPNTVAYDGGLKFQYLNRFDAPASSESETAIVRINLAVRVDRGVGGPATQTLTTDVALRNRLY
jgi:prepilin-type N-terminal cleavage/methylation domain-containing protein